MLCDIESPEKLGVRLNRVLINPYELNTKDAQYSYTITLPSSVRNDEVFAYAGVEEVKNKFNTDYNALLVVDGVTIFDGKFRMNEITPRTYKGNLVLPAKKTVKEIFEDTKMNKLSKEWLVDFKDIVESMNSYNKRTDIPPCIFPLVLYGLLPKVPQIVEVDKETGKETEVKYTDKKIWDESVRLGVCDFPPSINCMQTIKHIFESKGCKVEGDVFDDERMNNLYMSYKNPVDYSQEWNWAHLGKVHIKGSWTNYDANKHTQFEKYFYKNSFDRLVRYATNMFDSSMTDFEMITDNGTNTTISSTVKAKEDNPGLAESRRNRLTYTVPFSGLYKIRLKSKLTRKGENVKSDKGIRFVPSGYDSAFNIKCYELKLMRDFGEGIFDFSELNLDSLFYKENLPQETGKEDEQVHYFPKMDNQAVMMIDPKQNERLLSGFRWGNGTIGGNPLDPNNSKLCHLIAIKHGWSWDVLFSQKNKIFSAINSPAYEIVDKRKYDEGEEIITAPNMFGVELITSEENGSVKNEVSISDDGKEAEGALHQVVWLEKGENLSLVLVNEECRYNYGGINGGSVVGWMQLGLDFELEIVPFKKAYDWITIDSLGNSSDKMDWNSPSDFKEKQLDLVKFLPSEEKVDEWLEGFCKVFNLQLVETGNNNFEMSFKQRQHKESMSILDLSDRTNLRQRTNLPLGLPAVFELGFKINEEEQGFTKSKNKGNGRFETGTLDGSTVNQSSNFSYNWFFEELKRDGQSLKVPVITHKEIWTNEKPIDYAEMVKKLYTNYSQRFWYRSGNNYNVGPAWLTMPSVAWTSDKFRDFFIPELSNSYKGRKPLQLDYKDEPNSILRTFFNVIAPNESNYTEIECFLRPDEYDLLNGCTLVRYNDDLYHVGAIEGYDPVNKTKTKLKLIRKIK